MFPEPVLKGMAGVLATPVGMVHQTRCRLPAEPGHGQRIRRDVRRQAWLERPTHHLAVEQVEHDSQVEPAFIGPQVGNVGCSNLIWHRRREVAIKPVLRTGRPCLASVVTL